LFGALVSDLYGFREVKFFILIYHDTYSTMNLPKDRTKLSLVQCLQTVEEVITGLESSTAKGFLASQDLSKFPIVS
jgi:hypothetical protein